MRINRRDPDVDPPSITIQHDDKSATISPRTLSMLGRHSDMDEHVGMLKEKVADMAESLIDDCEVKAELLSAVKIAFTFVTPMGVIMDAICTIKVQAKPQKPEA